MTTKIPKELSSTPGIVDNSSATSVTIASDGFVQLERTGNEYGLELKSGGVRSGIVFKKPGTDTIQGSALMLVDESFRLGTASNYHIQMLQDGSTQVVNGLSILDGDATFASGHGISFAATGDGSGSMSSELLDDYEEGTWTPTLPNGGTITQLTAQYTKIGRFVNAYCYAIFTPTNNSSEFRVGGLPYAAANIAHFYGGGVTVYGGTFNFNDWVGPLVPYGGSYNYWHKNDGTSAMVLNSDIASVSGGLYLIFNMFYITNT